MPIPVISFVGCFDQQSRVAPPVPYRGWPWPSSQEGSSRHVAVAGQWMYSILLCGDYGNHRKGYWDLEIKFPALLVQFIDITCFSKSFGKKIITKLGSFLDEWYLGLCVMCAVLHIHCKLELYMYFILKITMPRFDWLFDFFSWLTGPFRLTLPRPIQSWKGRRSYIS